MQQHGLPMTWYVQQPAAAPQLISTSSSPGSFFVHQGPHTPYLVMQAPGGGPQQFVHSGPQVATAPQMVWIQQPNPTQPIFMNMTSQVQQPPQMYVMHPTAHPQHTAPPHMATASALSGQLRQGSAMPTSVPILPAPSSGSVSLHAVPISHPAPSNALPPKQSHSFGPPQPWQMQILSPANTTSFNASTNPAAASKQQDSHTTLSFGKRSFASTTTTHHLTHESEQPDPGVIHSVRPFLGPKQVGSILETPSKLPLLDVLPPLAKRKPRPLQQPVPVESQ